MPLVALNKMKVYVVDTKFWQGLLFLLDLSSHALFYFVDKQVRSHSLS